MEKNYLIFKDKKNALKLKNLCYRYIEKSSLLSGIKDKNINKYYN